jgi:hypothetical protein
LRKNLPFLQLPSLVFWHPHWLLTPFFFM